MSIFYLCREWFIVGVVGWVGRDKNERRLRLEWIVLVIIVGGS